MRLKYINYETDSMSSAEMEVYPIKKEADTAKKETETKKKSVSFSPSAQCRETLHVNNYSEEELESCWYTTSDLSKMRKECKPILRLLKNGMYPGDCDQRTARGLECRIKTGKKERRESKKMSWAAVLGEQQMQVNEGRRPDDEEIAEAYIYVSRHCVAAAYKMGIMDAMDVLDAIFETELQKVSSGGKSITGRRREKARVIPLSRIFGKRNRQ
eukprot:CAMPEP_0119014270 /NCGR_PEP_ID=MMETSP1176-20130426/9447_1 /TAXON_ID=265551 /ORGANISM="Synedropsis recta cf, Strain CCMP1620" /LENGTH=213 /DNA_ID=CAMNT_0006967425 /DNA_START=96 /DNA_END=737 /DNA_ORIENTATION=-